MSQLRAVTEHDAYLHLVLGELAVHGDGRYLRYGRMRRHRHLDLERRDVLTPPPDVVLFPVHEAEVAVSVDRAEITGVEPQIPEGRECRVGVAEVAQEHSMRLARPDHHRSPGAGGHRPAVGGDGRD